MFTIGVEEEFLLLGADGAVVPSAPYVARLARAGDQIKPEFLAYQLETTTAVCTRLDQLRRELTQLRLRASDAARRAGANLVAVGAPPFAAGPLGAVTDETRFREIAGRFPGAVVAGSSCACQVHIGVPDRDLAVEVLARIRPWLPALLALTVNSPFAGDRDTGWASYRYHLQQRWPTFRPPGAWAGAARYDRVVSSLVGAGAAYDAGAVFFLARLSERYPTVEVRVADACLSVDDTVLFAAVVRALVATLIEDARHNIATPRVPTGVVDAHLLTAAHGQVRIRRGRTHAGTAPVAAGAVARLMAKVAPALAAWGEAEEVHQNLERLRHEGTGADRQRKAWARTGSPEGFVDFLAHATAGVVSTHK
ncbi:YbdK family carboxylate-amine ligase [Paractinoplanes rhizophilus]|uniref:Putative glutamate--cysteine ligase 2 n=1 Tax=Paractinoplanes rhizophilus TaxID=1416877 RepID=A0ABW2I1Z3_9ACTN|nr:YbdK family carboxylate-amine ligase [Actinoplanes sp.]